MLRNIIFIDQLQIQSFCVAYKNYNNSFRPHQGLKSKIPVNSNMKPFISQKGKKINYTKNKHCDGMITSFEKVA